MLGADDVNVCWPVVVRVDDYSKVANSQDGRQEENSISLSGWVNAETHLRKASQFPPFAKCAKDGAPDHL